MRLLFLAVPAAPLFTKEVSAAISMGMRTLKPIAVQGALRDGIAHWLFLEKWDDPLPWREEKPLEIELATDASQTGWGGAISTPVKQETSDYWSKDQMMLDIATREAIAMDKVFHAFKDLVKDCRVDVMIDNLTITYAWNNQSIWIHTRESTGGLFCNGFLEKRRSWQVQVIHKPCYYPQRKVGAEKAGSQGICGPSR